MIRRLIAASLMLIAFLPANGRNAISLKKVDALYKILPSDRSVPEFNDTLRVARGEGSTIQFLISSEDTLDNMNLELEWKGKTPAVSATIGWVHDIDEVMYADDSTRLQDPAGRYPDPIYNYPPKGKRATAWTDIKIDRNAKAGCYKAKVTLTADNCRKTSCNFILKIYDVTLPEKRSLTLSNWHYSQGMEMMNGGRKVRAGSERYFQLLEIIAAEAARYNQNCWCIVCRPELKYNDDGTELILDFSKFDREVELLMKYGNLQRMTSGHFGGKDTALNDDLSFNVPCQDESGAIHTVEVAADDPRLDKYIKDYFPKLQKHLEEKGWLEIYAQHLADEPQEGGAESWAKVAAKIKTAAPGIRTVEACDRHIDNMDIDVRLLDKDIAELAPATGGKERWMYVCVVPQQNFANRFVQQPLIKTRLLHWINYRYDATGFLHWGLNWWDSYRQIRIPDGDSFLLYPDNEKVFPSIRAFAQRDGVDDYELLKMIQEADSAKAIEFAKELIYAPDDYNLDIRHFRDVRRRMLEFLSETR